MQFLLKFVDILISSRVNFLIYIVLILLSVLFTIFVVLFFVFALDSILRGHNLSTSKRAISALVKIISQYKPEANRFYDLGSGQGRVVLIVKRKLPHLTVYGIDNSAITIFFAKLKSKLLKQEVNFKRQDIFQTNLKNVDIIYTYLWYDLMPLLEKKLQKELKQGAIVITNTSNFPTWKPIQKVVTYPKVSKTHDFETLFVYVKN